LAGTVEIYTDGACSGNPGPAGIGIVLRYGDREKEHAEGIGIATNNIAELTAVLRALRMLKRTDLPVVIHTDSSYAIGVLTAGWKAKKNRELVEEIVGEMQRFGQLRLVKVEGHCNVPLNERADELARRGAAMAASGVDEE
jgi:ribonuclease HI